MVQFILLKPLKSNFLLFLEEAWTSQYVECKVPREWLLDTDQLMPPLEIGENWIWEVWGEWIGPCNNYRTGTVTGVQLILWVFRWKYSSTSVCYTENNSSLNWYIPLLCWFQPLLVPLPSSYFFGSVSSLTQPASAYKILSGRNVWTVTSLARDQIPDSQCYGHGMTKNIPG